MSVMSFIRSLFEFLKSVNHIQPTAHDQIVVPSPLSCVQISLIVGDIA